MTIGLLLWNTNSNHGAGRVDQHAVAGVGRHDRRPGTPAPRTWYGCSATTPTRPGRTALGRDPTGLAAAGDTHHGHRMVGGGIHLPVRHDTNTATPGACPSSGSTSPTPTMPAYWVDGVRLRRGDQQGRGALLPPVRGDGYFTTETPAAAIPRLTGCSRQNWWWLLADGARGMLGEAENVYPWTSGPASPPSPETGIRRTTSANIVTVLHGTGPDGTLLPGPFQRTGHGRAGHQGQRACLRRAGGPYSGFANSWVLRPSPQAGTWPSATCRTPRRSL